MQRNPLAAGGVFEPDPNNPLTGSYTAADAADWHSQNMRDTWAAVRDPQTWTDAADQYRSAMLLGSVAPELKGLGLDAQAMKVLRGMTPGAQAAVMDNPAFAKWFGASKVTNPDGSPLVLYHGTPWDISTFRRGANFLTEDPTIASRYTRMNIPGAQGPNVMPLYVRMENPLVHDHAGARWNVQTEQELIRAAKAGGHDGVIWQNIDDMGGPQTQYIALNPKQIKSAIGNSGKFDPKDPRITAGLAGLMAGGGAAAGVNSGNSD